MKIELEYLEYTSEEVKKMVSEAKSKEAKLGWFGYLLCMMHCEIISFEEFEELVDMLGIPKSDLQKTNFQ